MAGSWNARRLTNELPSIAHILLCRKLRDQMVGPRSCLSHGMQELQCIKHAMQIVCDDAVT